jgi:hypothetical protein
VISSDASERPPAPSRAADAMSDVEETVYLEDLGDVSPAPSQTEAPTGSSGAKTTVSASQEKKAQGKVEVAASTSGGTKRQRTLFDMMGGKGTSSASAPKKAKLAADGSSTSMAAGTSTGGKVCLRPALIARRRRRHPFLLPCTDSKLHPVLAVRV